MRTPLASFECTPLVLVLNAHPSRYPWNSGPIQWARGDVGLKLSAAARPVCAENVKRRAFARLLEPYRANLAF